MPGQTKITIAGDAFCINGQPTYAGRSWSGLRIEGLLLNSRMVQGIFDDLNPDTRARWVYSDTGRWDPERNTAEFCAAMAQWRAYGLLAFTLNLQGGSPEGYSVEQPWHNCAFEADGRLRSDYLARLERVHFRAPHTEPRTHLRGRARAHRQASRDRHSRHSRDRTDQLEDRPDDLAVRVSHFQRRLTN